MSAPLGTVLGASILVSCPVLWMVQAGTLSPTDAVQRWAICLAVCWIAITAVSALAFPDTRATPAQVRTGQQDQSEPIRETLPQS